MPKFENEERASVVVAEPTVIALAARAGDELHALVLLLPAATATVIPEFDRLFTAVSTAPKLRHRDSYWQLRVLPFVLTKSTPAICLSLNRSPAVEDTHATQHHVLGHAEGRTANRTCDVCAVTVAVLSVAAESVKDVGSTTTKLSVGGANAGIDDVCTHARHRSS